MESFRLADTMDSLRLGSESVLNSAVSLPHVRSFEGFSGIVVSRGGILGLRLVIARSTEVCERSVLELVMVSTRACDCDLLVDSSPEVSAVPYRIRELQPDIYSCPITRKKKTSWYKGCSKIKTVLNV